MIAADDVPDDLAGTVDSIQEFHGLGDGLSSIYRCLCQWPAYLDRAWADLEPTFADEGFEAACEAASDCTDGFVAATPYWPRLDPDSLQAAGFDDGTISDLADLFAEFNRGVIETVIPALPVYAATVDAAGRRAFRWSRAGPPPTARRRLDDGIVSASERSRRETRQRRPTRLLAK